MNRFISSKTLAAAGLALGAVFAASAAHARSDVYFSVGLQGAPVYYEPAPVYVQPRPVYVQPRTVYVQPREVYVQPVYGQYRHDDDRRWHRDHRGDRYAHNFGPYGDIDRDGIRNQDDRDRDGDGIRNRYDRFPDNPYRN